MKYSKPAGNLVATLVTLICLSSAALAFNFGFDLDFTGGQGAAWVDLLPNLSAWSPSSKAFGNTSTNTIKRQTFTVTNNGNDYAEGVAITVTGSMFSLYSTQTFGNISAGRTLTAKVRYLPTTAAVHSGFLSYTAANIARVQAALSGTGVSSLFLSDNFTSNTLSNYTQLSATNSVLYDSGNARVNSAGTGAYRGIYYNTQVPSATYYVQAKLNIGASTGNWSGIFLCGNGAGTASTGYVVQTNNSTTITLSTFNGTAVGPQTSWTFGGGKTWPVNTSHLVKVGLSGTTYHAYVDWNDDGDFGDADEDLGTKTHATYSGGRYVGIMMNTSTWVDNLEAN